MSESVEIDSKKLKAAYDDLDSLVMVVRGQAKTARDETPIPLPSLDGDFNRLVSWLEDQKPELKTRLDLAVLLDTKGTGHATYQVGKDTLDNTKTLLGNALAEGGMDLHAGGDAKQVRAYNEILATYAGDGKVMSPMFQKLGPENTLRVLSNVGQASVPPMSEDVEAKKRLIDLYRQGLGAASKESGFPDKDFADGLVKAATKDPEDYYGDPVTEYGLTSALSILMYDAKFSDDFSRELAVGLDKYERVDHKGQDDLWGHRDGAPGNFLWNEMVPFEAGNVAQDPMTSMNTMLANSPTAALEFYDDAKRQKYYIHDRNWNGDKYVSLSEALDAATTTPALCKDPEDGEKAAELASATVNYLGTRGNVDDLGDIMKGGEGSENFAHILGTYMYGVNQTVIGGQESLGADKGKVSTMVHLDGLGTVQNLPLFEKEAMAKFGLVAMSSDDGMAELRNATNRYESMRISGVAEWIKHPHNGADGHPINGQLALRDVIKEHARLEGFFLNAAGDAAIAEGKEKDEAVGKWVDHAESVVGLVPVPGVAGLAEGVTKEVVNLAIDDGKSAGSESLKEKLGHYEKDTRSRQNKDTDTALRQQEYTVAQNLVEEGLIKPDGLKGTPLWKDGGMLSYEDFSKQKVENQKAQLTNLMSREVGVGQYFNRTEYEGYARDEFSPYFPDKEK